MVIVIGLGSMVHFPLATQPEVASELSCADIQSCLAVRKCIAAAGVILQATVRLLPVPETVVCSQFSVTLCILYYLFTAGSASPGDG